MSWTGAEQQFTQEFKGLNEFDSLNASYLGKSLEHLYTDGKIFESVCEDNTSIQRGL